MKPITHYFSMNTEKWQQQRSKGFWHYVFFKGIVYLGICAGTLIFTLQYWQDTGFSISEMSLFIWFSDYLIWLPIVMMAGGLIATLVWLEFENKYGSEK